MDPFDDTEVDTRELGLRIELPTNDDGCPLRFPEDRCRERQLIDAVRYGEAESVDEIRHY